MDTDDTFCTANEQNQPDEFGNTRHNAQSNEHIVILRNIGTTHYTVHHENNIFTHYAVHHENNIL